MKRTAPIRVALAILSALAALAPAPASAGRVLTMEQAVEEALAHNASLRGRRSGSAADREEARSARGRLLPSLSVAALYDQVTIPGPGSLGGLLAAGAAPSGTSVQNLRIGLGLATASQPLLGLWHASHEYEAASRQADASEDEVRAAESDLREQVESSYLSLFEARAVRGIAAASRDELVARLRETEARLGEGAATRADLLRMRVALANAEQESVEAEVREKVTRASLLALIGLPPEGQDVDFAEPAEGASGAGPSALGEAEAYALQHRPEVRAAAEREAAAHHTRVASELRLLPELNATASYVRLQGFSSTLPADFFAFGLSLDWKLWDWGAAYFSSKAASRREEAAASTLEGTRSQVAFEVLRRTEEEKAASHALSVAEQAIDEAEEAYRVTAELSGSGAATTTDLLDAQSALTRARLNLARARYGARRARSALRKALGA